MGVKNNMLKVMRLLCPLTGQFAYEFVYYESLYSIPTLVHVLNIKLILN